MLYRQAADAQTWRTLCLGARCVRVMRSLELRRGETGFARLPLEREPGRLVRREAVPKPGDGGGLSAR